jgi:hypothetical protein
MAAISSGPIWRCPVVARIPAWVAAFPGLCLGDPRGDNGRAVPVAADLGIAPGDPHPGRFCPRQCCRVLKPGRTVPSKLAWQPAE